MTLKSVYKQFTSDVGQTDKFDARHLHNQSFSLYISLFQETFYLDPLYWQYGLF